MGTEGLSDEPAIMGLWAPREAMLGVRCYAAFRVIFYILIIGVCAERWLVDDVRCAA